MNSRSAVSISTGLNSSRIVGAALPPAKKVSRITAARWNCGSVPTSVPSGVPSTARKLQGRVLVSM